MAEKETVKLVAHEMSTGRVLLGAKGITNASGLKGVSEKYSLDLNTLKDYPQTNSTLSAKGKIFLAGKSNKLTPDLLKAILSLGEEGIAKAGGLRELSKQYKVNLSTLNNYLNKKGTLTVRGEAILGGKPNKVSPEMLMEIMSLGAERIAKAGGLQGLSEKHNVNLSTLNSYLDKNGTLKVRGESFLAHERQ